MGEMQRSEPPQLIQPPPPPVSYSARESNSGGSGSHLEDSDQLSTGKWWANGRNYTLSPECSIAVLDVDY